MPVTSELNAWKKKNHLNKNHYRSLWYLLNCSYHLMELMYNCVTGYFSGNTQLFNKCFKGQLWVVGSLFKNEHGDAVIKHACTCILLILIYLFIILWTKSKSSDVDSAKWTMFLRSSVKIIFDEFGSEKSNIFVLNLSARLTNCVFVLSLILL